MLNIGNARGASSGAPLSPKTSPMASLRHAPQRLSLSQWRLPFPGDLLPAAGNVGSSGTTSPLRHPSRFSPSHRLLPVPLPSPTPATPPSPSPFPPPAPCAAAFSDTGDPSLSVFLPSACSLRPFCSLSLPSPSPFLPPAASPCSLPRCLLRHRPPLPSPTPAAATHSRLLPCPFRPASSLSVDPAASSTLSSPISLSLPSLNPLFFRTSASPLGPPGLPLLLPLPSIFAPRRVCLCLAAAAASSSEFCSGSDFGKAYLDCNC